MKAIQFPHIMKTFYLNKSAFDLKVNFIQKMQLFHLISLICEFIIMSNLKNKNKKEHALSINHG